MMPKTLTLTTMNPSTTNRCLCWPWLGRIYRIRQQQAMKSSCRHERAVHPVLHRVSDTLLTTAPHLGCESFCLRSQVLEKHTSEHVLSFGICDEKKRKQHIPWSNAVGEWCFSCGLMQRCDDEGDTFFCCDGSVEPTESVPRIVAGDILGVKFTRADSQRGPVTMVFSINGAQVYSYSDLQWRHNFVLAVGLPQSTSVKLGSSLVSNIDSIIDRCVLHDGGRVYACGLLVNLIQRHVFVLLGLQVDDVRDCSTYCCCRVAFMDTTGVAPCERVRRGCLVGQQGRSDSCNPPDSSLWFGAKHDATPFRSLI